MTTGLKLIFNTSISNFSEIFSAASIPFLAAGETQYSYDEINFINITSKSQALVHVLPAGYPIFLRGNFAKTTTSDGAINGLKSLFDGNTRIVSARGDIRWIDYDISQGVASVRTHIPTAFRYRHLFRGCVSMTAAPALPATTLAANCYQELFLGCTSLTELAPCPIELENCWIYWSKKCEDLITVSALPATTLAMSCYRSMFSNCTGLTAAPALPATTLATDCYNGIFQGCRNLNRIAVPFSVWHDDATTNWVLLTSATGTFTCPAVLPDVRGEHNIPTGWTRTNL